MECAWCPFPSLACPRLCCRQLQGTALCTCRAPPLLHVPHLWGHEAAFPEQAQVLYVGFQELYQHPATVEDVSRYLSVRCNAYNEEEVRWFEATYDYLEGQLDAEQAKHILPAKK